MFIVSVGDDGRHTIGRRDDFLGSDHPIFSIPRIAEAPIAGHVAVIIVGWERFGRRDEDGAGFTLFDILASCVLGDGEDVGVLVMGGGIVGREGERPWRKVSRARIALGAVAVHSHDGLALCVATERNGTGILDGGILVELVRRVGGNEPLPARILEGGHSVADGVVAVAEGAARDGAGEIVDVGPVEALRANHLGPVGVGISLECRFGERFAGIDASDATADFVVRVVEAGNRPVAIVVVNGGNQVAVGFVDVLPGVTGVRGHPGNEVGAGKIGTKNDNFMAAFCAVTKPSPQKGKGPDKLQTPLNHRVMSWGP